MYIHRMKSKILISCLLLILIPGMDIQGKSNWKKLPANHEGISYIGRTHTDAQGTVSYDWVGTYFQTDFTGGYFAVQISDTKCDYLNLFIDGKWIKKIKMDSHEPTTLVLAENMDKHTHRLRLQKCTEARCGKISIHQVILPQEGTLKAVPHKERFIEIYGDSYTCGFGTESNNPKDPFSAATENCNQAYGCIIARYFDADYALVAHSGQGMSRNYGDSVQVSKINQFVRSTRVFDEADNELQYDFKAYTPSLVLINLGTNDMSKGNIPSVENYVGNYLRMIRMIRRHYDGVPILCVTPHSANDQLLMRLDVLRKCITEFKDVYVSEPMPNVVTVKSDMGACYHPNYQGQKKIAMTLIPKISAIMGWQLTDKVVE